MERWFRRKTERGKTREMRSEEGKERAGKLPNGKKKIKSQTLTFEPGRAYKSCRGSRVRREAGGGLKGRWGGNRGREYSGSPVVVEKRFSPHESRTNYMHPRESKG